MRNYLYLYGNHSIKNTKFTIGETTNDTADGVSIQKMSLARSYGSRVVNATYNDKTIKINGEVVDITTSGNKLEDLTMELHRIYNYQDRYFRIVPDYQIICTGQNLTNVFDDLDASGTSTIDTSFFQYSQDPNNTSSSLATPSSIKFDCIGSSNREAQVIKYFPTPLNLASKWGTGNLEFWVDIPNVYEVQDVTIILENASSDNFAKKTFTTNYEGKPIENGVNYFSVPFNASTSVPRTATGMTQGGTFNPASIVNIYINITFDKEDYSDVLGCHWGDIFWVNENRVRNYPTYREGEVSFGRDYVFSPNKRNYTANLLNYKGYGMATHEIIAGELNSWSTSKSTFQVDLAGSYEPQPKLSIICNSPTNLNSFQYKNLTTNQVTSFSNSWVAGSAGLVDKLNNVVTKDGLPQDFSGKIPSFNLGRNWVELGVTSGTGLSTVSQTTSNAERYFDENGFVGPLDGSANALQDVLAQSFVSSGTGTLKEISVLVRGNNNGWAPPPFWVALFADSGGNPNATNSTYPFGALETKGLYFTSSSTLTWQTVTFNTAVTIGTTYWIVLYGQETGSVNKANGYWGENTAGGYASGTGKTKTYTAPSTHTWATTSRDFAFSVTVDGTTGFDIDYSLVYTPLYQ